jgi:amino acid transporter
MLEPSVPRKLTLLPLVAAIYFIVAGGPFGIEDIVARAGYGGAFAILALTPLLWSLPTALMIAELASALPCEGGYYVWVTRALGRFWGFQEAWLSMAGSIFDMAIYPTLFVGYLGHFAPSVTAGARGTWIGLALIAAAAVWNLLGARRVGLGSTVMGVLLLAPFVTLTGYALLHRAAAGPAPAGVPPQGFDLLGGVLVAMWNYMGWDNVSTVAGEVERPRRTYPLAMGVAVALVAVSYALPVAAVWLAGLPAARWSTDGWADVARAVMAHSAWGEAVAAAITAGGLIGAAGTMGALTMCYSRVPAVMAEDGWLPRVFARRTAAGAPWAAIAACAAAWALCLQLSFVKLIVLDILLTGGSILLEFAALVALRVREPLLARPFRIPGGMAGAIAAGLFPLGLMALAAVRNADERIGPVSALQLGALLVGLGVVAYWVGERFRKS